MNSVLGMIIAFDTDNDLREITEHRTVGAVQWGGRYRIIDFIVYHMVNIYRVGVLMKDKYQSLIDHIGNAKDWDLSRKNSGVTLLPPYSYSKKASPLVTGEYRGKIDALAGSAAAVLAVTTAGYVRTRVARVRTGLSRENAAALAALLNRNLTFVAPVDLSTRLLAELCSQIDPELVPVISAAAAILQDSVKPHVFLGGEQYLLDWPQLDGKVGDILTLLNDEEQAAGLIAPPAERSESVLLGEDLEPQIPGLCIVSDRYLVGGGLWGSIALIGPTRMPFQKLMPLLHLFADELGEGMSGKRKDTPQMAAPRRTVIYKEDLE